MTRPMYLMAPGAALASLLLVVAAQAQDHLEPRDFSPDEEVPIRVERIETKSIATSIVVVVGNRGKSTITATFECSLYDASNRAVASDAGLVKSIPPQSEAVKSLTHTSREIARAACRITDVRDE